MPLSVVLWELMREQDMNNIYSELPLDNFIRFLKYHNWYMREKNGNWSTYVMIHICSTTKIFTVYIPDEENINLEDNNWKETAVKTLAESHHRSLLSIAGEIADFNDSRWRMINIASVEILKKIIPKGDYCYGEDGPCPFLAYWDEMGKQSNGYCHFLQKGDWHQNGTSLLWDGCKSCGINNNEIEEK